MFFNKESKRIAELESKIENLSNILLAHGKLIRSLVDSFKHSKYGVKDDGTPRKKPGRPRKVVV